LMKCPVRERVLNSLFDNKYEEVRQSFAKSLNCLINFQIDSYVREDRCRMFQRQTEFKRFKNNFHCPRDCDRRGQIGLCSHCLKINYGRGVKFKDKVDDFQICSVQDFVSSIGSIISQGSINFCCERCMNCEMVLKFEINSDCALFVDVKFECNLCGQYHSYFSTRISISKTIPFWYDLDVKIARDRSYSIISVFMVETISSRYGLEKPWVDAYEFDVED